MNWVTKSSLALFLFLACSLITLAVETETAALKKTFLLTATEQATVLANITHEHVKPTINLISDNGLKYFQRDLRSEYLKSDTYERSLLSERIGNQGRARFATESGWIKILGSQSRGIVQGPDAIYWDPNEGVIRVTETKGGSSKPKFTYGSWQGTNSNTIRSAEFALRSPNTSMAEKVAQAQVILAAKNGNLQTGIIRTSHDLGRPALPRLEKDWATANIGNQASVIERRLVAENPELANVFKRANFDLQMNQIKYPSGQSLFFIKSEQIVQCGRLAGKFFLPVATGFEVWTVVNAYYEYSSGRINQLVFYRRSTGPVIFAVCTGSGAVIGFFAGGVGAVPGAGIGALVSVPLTYAGDFTWDWYFRNSDRRQMEVVFAALENQYGK